MKSARARLDRLAILIKPPVGCPTCRDWSSSVALCDDGYSRPLACPTCLRVVPYLRVRTFTGVNWADI